MSGIYRGADLLARLEAMPVTLCGAGALGSLLADNLARQGFRLWKVIDRDRVEEHNVGTQLYGESEVGAWKVEALRSRLFRAVGVEIEAVAKELTDRNARSLFKGSGVVIDAFDNSAARAGSCSSIAARGPRLPSCRPLRRLRRGDLGRELPVPSDVGVDVCDYPLARNLVLLAVSVAAESLVRFVRDGTKGGWSITLCDFAIRPLETGRMA